MTKFRYPTSLLLSSLLYGGIVFAFVTLLHTVPHPQKRQKSVIKVALITPKPQPTPPPKVAPKKIEPIIPPQPIIKKEKPKPKPKPKPKKSVIKKKSKPKPKKVSPKKKTKQKAKPKPKIKPKPIIEQQQIEPSHTPPPKTIPTKAPSKTVTPKRDQPPTPQKEDLSLIKKAFLRGVRGDIYANKRYPSIAKRRHIQGRVHVVFTILRSGEISNIQTSGASRLLQKAARKSILKSSPFTIPSKLLGQFPMQNVNIDIDFKLQ
jgi:protein TonB